MWSATANKAMAFSAQIALVIMLQKLHRVGARVVRRTFEHDFCHLGKTQDHRSRGDTTWGSQTGTTWNTDTSTQKRVEAGGWYDRVSEGTPVGGGVEVRRVRR